MHKQNSHKEIIVVSGLPRSGTSLMMQMLEAGGLPLYHDKERPADINNPQGYYELQSVKNLKQNNSFLERAENRAVKIVSHLLTCLPDEFYYKIIFMQRRLQEIIESQNKMLSRLKDDSANPDNYGLKKAYIKHLGGIQQWLKNTKNSDHLFVSYNKLLESPKEHARLISAFLQQDLNIDKMNDAVKPSLYRTKL